jgi:hypothetical protein
MAVRRTSSHLIRHLATGGRVQACHRWAATVAHARAWLGIAVRHAHGTKMVPLQLKLFDGRPKDTASVSVENVDVVHVVGVGPNRPQGRDNHVHRDALQVGIPRQGSGVRLRSIRWG